MAKKSVENSENKKERNPYATQKQIAALLKVTEFDIKKYIRLGLPKAGNNKYVPAECISWYIDYLNYWKDRRTISEIAAMFGVSERWVNRLVVEKGIKKEKHGVYRIDSTIAGYVNFLKEQIKKAEDGETTLNDERKRLLRMQSDLKEIELLEKQENLIPKRISQQLITEFAAIAEKKFDSLPGLCLDEAFSCTKKEQLLKVLKDSVHKIKTEVAKEEHKINETPAKK